MSITYHQANKLLDEMFGGTDFTPPDATLYVGLSIDPPTAGGSSNEPTGIGNYARVAITNNKTNWDTAASGILDNDVAIQFPESDASWGTMAYVCIFDAMTTGNLLYWEALTSSRTVASDTTVIFAVGALVVKMNNT